MAEADLVREMSFSEAVSFARAAPEHLPDVEAAHTTNTFAVLDTLRDAGIDRIAAPQGFDPSDAHSTLKVLYNGTHDALTVRGLPDPDIGFYQDVARTAEATGLPIGDALEQAKAGRPLQMRADLAPPDAVTLLPEPDPLLTPAPELEGPAADTRYEVHFMAYPLEYREIGGIRVLDTVPAHAFVVVTEAGKDPMDFRNIELAARGGPDHEGAFNSSSPWDDGNVQSPSSDYLDRGNDGDVYASSDQFARENDGEKLGRFHIETAPTTYDLETLEDLIQSHRDFVNTRDIDYILLESNSNTYAGDVYELTTGREPPEEGHARGYRRTLPAVENDLVNYRDTEFADHFRYGGDDRSVDPPEAYRDHDYHYSYEEEAGYDAGL